MKKIFATALMCAIAAVAVMTTTSCSKDGDDGKKKTGSSMTVTFNDLTYSFPTPLAPDDFYYFDYPPYEDYPGYPGDYELYFNWQSPDGRYIEINIDMSKSLTGATPYTLAEGEDYWYFDAEIYGGDTEFWIGFYAENDYMGEKEGDSDVIVSGKIRMEHLGGGKFRLVANAVNYNGDTFSIDFEGTLHKSIAG